MSEPTTMQEMVDGQLAELQITTAEVTGETYKERHAAKIAALAEEEAALPTPTDKASLQVVQDFITKSEKARTGIDKFRKAFKDRWKPMLDAVDAYLGTTKESGRQAEIYAIQQRAEAKKKAYLDEQAKAAREAERLLEERYTGRVAKLLEAGMVIEANGNLTIRDGEQTLSALPRDIRFATDEQMATVLGKVETIRAAQIERDAAAQQAKEEEEREAAELKARLAQQEEQQRAEAAKLRAEREALEKEREEMADHRAETRGADLVVLGATCHGYGPAIRYEIGDVIVGHGELRHMDAETWIKTRERVRLAKVKAIEEQKEREAQINRQKEREAMLGELGADEIDLDGGFWTMDPNNGPTVYVNELRTMTSDEWAPVLARFKEAAEARGGPLDLELVPDPEANGATWTDPQEWTKRIEADPEAGSILTIPAGGIAGPRPLQEGSAVGGAQPDIESGVVITQRHPDEIALEAYRDALLAVVHPCFDDLCLGTSIDKIRFLRTHIAEALS